MATRPSPAPCRARARRSGTSLPTRRNSMRLPDSTKWASLARMRAPAVVLAFAAFCAFPVRAAEDAALLKDLGAALVVLGLPCGAVVAAKQQAPQEHLVSCKDGNRYRVFVNAAGRVV